MQKAARLVECIADLQMGAISPTQWLEQIADVAQCDAACVLSWSAGEPDKTIANYSSNPIEIDKAWLPWVDNLVRTHNPELPALLENTARSASVLDDSDNSPLNDPQLLIAILDNEPAVILFIFRKDSRANGWSDDDRYHLSAILPGLRKAHLVHKKITIAENRLNIANNALDAIPRAVLALTPTGGVIKANEPAAALLQRDSFKVKDGKLFIANSRVMQQLQDKLAEIRILSGTSLATFVWNRSFRCHNDRQNYQLMLSSFMLDSWHLESSSYDRVVELVIGSLDLMIKPTTDQLRDFYDLSGAEARVVIALLEGNDILTSAAKLHVSVNTIRSHVRSIYAKLGVDNQRDLQRLLSSTLVNYSRRS